jgi:magnesium chelatase family protein
MTDTTWVGSRVRREVAMVETVASAAVTGLDVQRVRVEVSITRGTPLIQIVGLAQSAVREGRERIRAAASQLGLHVPGLRITVNLAPAGLPKHGAAFDLPMMIGILAAAGELPVERVRRYALVGELGLDGCLRSIRGALPIALHAARHADVRGLILPLANLRETRPASGIDVRGASSLTDVIDFMRGGDDLPLVTDLPPDTPDAAIDPDRDLRSVSGQQAAKRALEVAAAGGHNLLLRGAPGAGKTTLARCLPALLPPMSLEEAVEATAIHSVAGRLPDGAGLLERRPFRAPHHTISNVGLIGGGALPRPGEISLAHRGVLFLDEFPEFGRGALEALRQPLEEGVVHVARARARARFPARFTLVAAMNPCPCGHHGAPDDRCTCGPASVSRYTQRISGPLLDRIDLHLEVPAVAWSDLVEASPGEASRMVRERVQSVRARSARRFADLESTARCNADLGPREIEAHCAPDREGRALLRSATQRLGLSARGYFRSLRVARTIADLAESERILSDHVAEALRYRGLEGRDAWSLQRT